LEVERNERTVQNLTSRTVAILCIKRLLSTELILHSPTMTARFIQRLESVPILILVHLVRSTELPLIVLSFDI